MTTETETQEVTEVPVGENIKEALQGANTPMATLAAAYNHAPHPMFRAFIDDRVLEILMVDMTKLHACVQQSPAIVRDEMTSISQTFQDAVDLADTHAPEEAKALTATIRDIGLTLGEGIDKAIGRVLLEDTVASRMAYYDLISAHAKIVKILIDLALTDAQKAELEANGESNPTS